MTRLSYTEFNSFGLVVPLANEANGLNDFVAAITKVFDSLSEGFAYLVVDNVSKDNTLDLCKEISSRDSRFLTVWAPENRNVVDAYIRGYREAFDRGHPWIIEMDGGFSHDPRVLPQFVEALKAGNMAVFGSRFIAGGSIEHSNLKRTFLAKGGTILSNLFLGTKLRDMTSGYQGFHSEVVAQILNYPLMSKAHFYQTELRYLARTIKYVEIPIQYRAPSPSVSRNAIVNSFSTLGHYISLRLRGKSPRFT